MSPAVVDVTCFKTLRPESDDPMLNVGDLEQCWHAGFKQRHRQNNVEFDARRQTNCA